MPAPFSLVRREKAAAAIEQADIQHLRDGIHEAGAADAARRTAAQHMALRVFVNRHMVNRAGRAAHAMRNLRPFKGRACGGGTGDQPVFAAQHDFAVRANVNGQRQLIAGVKVSRQDDAHRVRADKSGNQRQRHDARLRKNVQADFPRRRHAEFPARRKIRRNAQMRGRNIPKKMLHAAIADKRHFVNLLRINVGLLAQVFDQIVERGADALMQTPQTRLALPRKGNARHHVAAVHGLPVQGRRNRNFAAGMQIEQISRHRCRADVNGDAVKLLAGVARLNGNDGILPARDRQRGRHVRTRGGKLPHSRKVNGGDLQSGLACANKRRAQFLEIGRL